MSAAAQGDGCHWATCSGTNNVIVRTHLLVLVDAGQHLNDDGVAGVDLHRLLGHQVLGTAGVGERLGPKTNKTAITHTIVTTARGPGYTHMDKDTRTVPTSQHIHSHVSTTSTCDFMMRSMLAE